MNKDNIEKIINEYESDKENKGFFTIITNDGKKYGQIPKFKEPLRKFELFDDETLLVEFCNQTWYISIEAINGIFFRSKFLY